MAELDHFPQEQMRAEALARLQEWLPGYTDTLGDGRQRKLGVTQTGDNWLIVEVDTLGVHGGKVGPKRTFKVMVEAKEITT